MVIRLTLLVAACAVDVLTTKRHRDRGGSEKNLIPAFLIDAIGFWPAALGTKLLFVALALWFNQAGFYDGMIVANGTAAAINLYRLRRKRKAK